MKEPNLQTPIDKLKQEISVKIAGEELLFSNEKIIYLPKQETLLLADFHLGKVEHFRKNGLWVPREPSAENLKRLVSQIIRFQPKSIIFLGDLFHSIENDAVIALQQLIENFPAVKFQLVFGNHDILPEALYNKIGLTTYSEPYSYRKFQLSHLPPGKAETNHIQIFGHLHPAIRLKGKGRQYLKLSCFHISGHQIAMPAFGGFTGTSLIRPAANDTVLACSDVGIFKMS